MNSETRDPATGTDEAIRALLLLRAEIAQRETRMGAAFEHQLRSMRQELDAFRSDVMALVGDASRQIAKEAREAVSPVAAEYDRAVSATSAHLQGATRTVWSWLAATGVTLLLVSFVGWAVLGLYRRELADVREQLDRYEDAVPVVQAFYASDAVLCDGRVCVNVDPDGKRLGDARQYRQARPR